MKKIIYVIIVFVSALIFITCSSDSDKSPSGSNNTNDLTAEEFFSITNGRSMSGIYASYVSDNLRNFTSSNDTWSFTASIGNQVQYNNIQAYPITVEATRQYFPNPTFTDTTYNYTIYLNVVDDKLYWYGGIYCGFDIPLSPPVIVASFPLQNGSSWVNTTSIISQIRECNTILIDSVSVQCVKESNVTVRNISYDEVYILRLSVKFSGLIRTRYYELWYAPEIGPIRGAGFFEPDSTTTEFTKPKDGWEAVSYN